MTSAGMLEEGRRAFDRRAWDDAYAHLSAVLERGALDPGDLRRLAIAAYLTGHDEQSTDAWTRAHQAYLERNDPQQAVRCAFWCGFGLFQRGEMAQGGGWLARARRIVEEGQLDCAECGYLLVPQAVMALEGGDYSAAHETSGEISAIARRFGDPDLAAMGTLGQGQSLIRLGHVDQGMRLFDEAMVSVTAGEVSSVVSGIVYCAVIDECYQAFDVRRAQEWTFALDRWCDAQPGLVLYRGQCLVHRSQVMQLHGAWGEAMTEVEKARERLTEPPHPAIGMAYYQLGELYRLRGNLVDAEEAYRRAHGLGRGAQPGFALLRLAQGRVEDAVVGIERATDDAQDHIARAKLLSAYVEIMLAAARKSEARRAADELTELATVADAAMLEAAACHSRGAVLLAEGDLEGAMDALRQARQAWLALEAPYEAAQTRILIALACRAVGDHDTAELECGAARAALEELGAGPALARLARLFADGHGADSMLTVTSRELDVLRLVATGRTNRQIAEDLVISEKTVERHVSNIFTKLGVSNRAAATAYAYDHDLV